MNNLNQATLNYSIPQELELIQRKYRQFKSSKDVESQQKLYKLLVTMNRQLYSPPKEDDYWSTYRMFDR